MISDSAFSFEILFCECSHHLTSWVVPLQGGSELSRKNLSEADLPIDENASILKTFKAGLDGLDEIRLRL